MKPATFEQVPGGIPTAEEGGSSGLLVYTIGLLLAVALTATSFWIANTHMLWGPGTPIGLAVLAIAQMGVHLVFFLHITSGPENTNNSLALAFGVLVVTLIITGSLVIMGDLKMTMGGTMGASMQGQ
ncbi:cytochrome o ubiquinol oxidase subunit IV [Piscinibacter sp. XHJ-5]|uniref:cytochrome o ubiquinol oxidase subunit IV n=1 Tax=Piscinibacter sp. XHJ-5 TaxID=3037797 RepID=UPI0024530809|nr:cytochrome o ubiquinol oxidase subunit IV [Piscinibacter sp. XHJ-5]